MDFCAVCEKFDPIQYIRSRARSPSSQRGWVFKGIVETLDDTCQVSRWNLPPSKRPKRGTLCKEGMQKLLLLLRLLGHGLSTTCRGKTRVSFAVGHNPIGIVLPHEHDTRVPQEENSEMGDLEHIYLDLYIS